MQQTGWVRGLGSRIWLPISLVGIFLAACGQDTPDTSDAAPMAATAAMTADTVPTEPTTVMTAQEAPTASADSPTTAPKDVSGTILATATPAPRIGGGGGPPPRPPGVVSIEELYLEAEYVVRVELVTTTVATTTKLVTHPATGAQWTTWCIFLNFSFRTIDYLKGSGPGEITAVAGQCGTQEWLEGPGVAEVAGYHDTQWDDRQAIVFLKTYDHLDGAYAFMSFIGARDTNYYQVTSDIAKQWLPAAHSSDGVGTGSLTDPTYLLDAPATSSPSGAGGEADDPPPTISLSALKKKLADLAAQASFGGTAEYQLCVEHYYYSVRLARYKRDSEWEPYPLRHIYGIESGQPPGIVLHRIDGLRGRAEDNLGRYWFEGPDPDVVKFSPTDFVHDGDGIWFTQDIVTARPLPTGSYEYYSNGMPPWEVDCNLYPEEKRTHVHHRLKVTAPTGTLHEAFFDPMAIGNAIGADGTIGVLRPNLFTLGGTAVTITRCRCPVKMSG